MFEQLRARLEQFLAQHTSPPEAREIAARMQEAVVDAKVALGQMRDSLLRTERELTTERRHLEDAERRGRLAAGIADGETAEVAERFAAKHRERVQVLERKLEVQREELALADRELEEMMAQLRTARQAPSGAARAAWRDIEAAGGHRPETDLESELLRSDLDRTAREAAADAQLAQLKRKLGKDRS